MQWSNLFNSFPNLPVSLTDPQTLDVLTLNVKNYNYKIKTWSHIYEILYRLHYQITNTRLDININVSHTKDSSINKDFLRKNLLSIQNRVTKNWS